MNSKNWAPTNQNNPSKTIQNIFTDWIQGIFVFKDTIKNKNLSPSSNSNHWWDSPRTTEKAGRPHQNLLQYYVLMQK